MEGASDNKALEQWDRLVLLLIAQPRGCCEVEYEEIIRREIERLKPASALERGNE